MRNPNYTYKEAPNGGWYVHAPGGLVWGKTKAAARSKLLRLVRKQYPRLTKSSWQYINEGGTNDQS